MVLAHNSFAIGKYRDYSQSMIRSSQQELVGMLQKHGLKFTYLTVRHEGSYLPTDADWNYKDVPHLNLVHSLVDACYGMVGDQEIATINMQKIFGFKFPLTVFNYQSGPGRQTYFASFFFYQLIVETMAEQIAPLKTVVTTTYAIGSSPFWQVFAPLFKYALKKNYNVLMSEDIPMRSRRGELRAMGYTFKGDDKPYSFRETMNISDNNLIAPDEHPSSVTESLSLAELKANKVILLGNADLHGLRAQYDETTGGISVFLRTCPHEGASLDQSACEKNMLTCAWHGRKFQPLIQLRSGETKREAAGIAIQLDGDRLKIERKVMPNVKTQGAVDRHQ